MVSRISIFTGHYGSGKTEIAINYAIKKAKEGKKVALVDIDIVTPYFCSRELKNKLKNKYGIDVISSNPDLVNGELMVLSGDVLTAFHNKNLEIVFDVGGDSAGARALGQYNKYFKDESYNMYFVMNNLRPMTNNYKTSENYLKLIESSSRLKVTHIISNTHLLHETNINHILAGDQEAIKLSKELNIPYRYTTCMKHVVEDIKDKVYGEILPIDIFIKNL